LLICAGQHRGQLLSNWCMSLVSPDLSPSLPLPHCSIPHTTASRGFNHSS
jgi:hypothetical protein